MVADSAGYQRGLLLQYVALSLLGERALQESNQRIREERLIIAQMAAGHIDQWLQEEIDELEQAHIRADFDAQDPNLESEVDFLANSYRQLNEFPAGFVLLDAEGVVVAARPAELYPIGADLSDLPHVDEALERRQTTISTPFSDPVQQLPVTALTVPMFENDQLKGLLSGLLDLNRPQVLAALREVSMLGATAHATLLDADGRVLISTAELPYLAQGEHATFYRRALGLGQPLVESTPLERPVAGEPDGNPHIVAFAPLQSTNWGMFVGGDRGEALAGVTRLRAGLILLGIVALAMVWGGTLVGTRRLLKPVRRLTRAAQKVAHGDLQSPIEAGGGKEMQAMASALEEMRAQLLRQMEGLTALNQTLEARVEEQTADLRQQQARTQALLRKVITAQEEERKRIARELHDELGQLLTAVEINLDRLRRKMSPAATDAQKQLARISRLTGEAIHELRRLVGAMRPAALDELGLIPALGSVANQTLRPLKMDVTFEADEALGQLPEEVETTLFRIAQEAMNNVARHSRAQHVLIQVGRSDGNIRLVIRDDGVGWDRTVEMTEEHGNVGLASIHERASLLGGRVQIDSVPGAGTMIEVTIPLAPGAAGDHGTAH